MAILEDEVDIYLGNNVKYYKNLGYEIPKYKNNHGKFVTVGATLKVKLKDLPSNCTKKITRICDGCGKITPDYIYRNVLRSRKRNENLDLCLSCSLRRRHEKTCIPPNESLWGTSPEVAKYLKDENIGYKRTRSSNKREVFVCDKCGQENSIVIADVTRRGFKCQACSDGLSFSEKCMFSILKQLNLEFMSRKTFDWSEFKEYDFYIPSLECIIEVHGLQHYNGGFKSFGGRSAKEEQENDRLKEELAKINGVKYYISIDCRHSQMDWIKSNVTSSELKEIVDLTNVDWRMCHKFACNSMVKNVCQLWNDGLKNKEELARETGLHFSTVIRYLKKGNDIGICEYDPKDGRRKNLQKLREKQKKSVVQLTLNDEFVKEYESLSAAARALHISSTMIYRVCKGKRSKSGGFKWMYKNDYEIIQKDSIRNYCR